MAVHELAGLCDRTHVFRDRAHAGEVVAGTLELLHDTGARFLAFPTGDVPVDAAIARGLGWPLGVAVVSKITLLWNCEVGYGAVAFDGSGRLNEQLIRETGVSVRALVQLSLQVELIAAAREGG